ncbi:hypothetical protein BJ322DRAFT_1024425 [Thelephora terrestris]|uniref:Uncharacterized protein n=1 Tax=Thelephora terrestris TaxID=56493 RepID=A0A9P6H746_9AGAM|nr:hypothetical protein BJ322DRAFT_1024425 [Thelephora terrestris]
MSSSRPPLQGLVDNVNGELGGGETLSVKITPTIASTWRRARHSTPVDWADLFKEITIRANNVGLSSIPPEAIMIYVANLKMWPLTVPRPGSLDAHCILEFDEKTRELEKICRVVTPADILSTLDPTKHTRLEWTRLMTDCIYGWINKRSYANPFSRVWSNLDTALSELATVAISTKRKELTIVLTSTRARTLLTCVGLPRREEAQLFNTPYVLSYMYTASRATSIEPGIAPGKWRVVWVSGG